MQSPLPLPPILRQKFVRICMNLICTVVPVLPIPLSEFNEFIPEQTAEWFYFCRSAFWNVTFMCYSGKWGRVWGWGDGLVGCGGGSPRPVKILYLFSSKRQLNSNWVIVPKLTEMGPTNISGHVLSHHWCEAFSADDWGWMTGRDWEGWGGSGLEWWWWCWWCRGVKWPLQQ